MPLRFARPSSALRQCLPLLLCCAFLAPVAARCSVFLDIPGIPGESRDQNHPNQIGVTSWAWGLVVTGAVSSPGKVELQALTISKAIDVASPKLMRAACAGTEFPSNVLAIQQGPKDFYRLTLGSVRVSAVSQSSAAGAEPDAETVTLRFKKFQLDYLRVAPGGGTSEGSGVIWDTGSNTGAVYTNVPPVVTTLVASMTFSTGASTAMLSWPAVPGQQYLVSFSEDLTQPFTAYRKFTADSEQAEIPIPLDKAQQFFRIQENTP